MDSNESPSVFSSFMSAYWYFCRRKPLWRHDWRRGVQFCGKWSENAQNVNYKPWTVSRPLVKESFREYVTTAIQLQARSKQWGVGHMKKKQINASAVFFCFFFFPIAIFQPILVIERTDFLSDIFVYIFLAKSVQGTTA